MTSATDAILAILPALPKRTKEELRRLLGYELAFPDRRRSRYGRLGLLWEMISRGDGLVPTVRSYDDHRQSLTDGSEWPSASNLSRTYGGWAGAMKAAIALGQSFGPTRRTARQPERRYATQDAERALRAFRKEIGAWPTRGEYERWADIRRDIEIRFGSGIPSTPTVGVFRRIYGSWARAIEVVDRTIGDVPAGAGDEA